MDQVSPSTTANTEHKQLVYPTIKRLFDIIFSISFLIALSPLYLLIALMIKLGSKGPIFYVTKRLGKGKQMIHVYKFRTMFIDAEERLDKLLEQDPDLKKEWLIYRKLKDDPRCTFIGKFLRRTSLDEIPQFVNVIKGELSVVGPRPHEAEELEKKPTFQANADKILSIKPGITGIWQTSGRNNLSFDERIKLESLYVNKQGFLFDLFLIIKTIPIVLLSKGAF